MAARMTERLLELGNIDASASYFLGRRFDKTVSILDVGTRFGSFLHRLALFGYSNVYGIDIDAYSIGIGREVYPSLASRIQVYDGKSIPYPNASFDVITMFDVIEHIPALDTFLSDIGRVLRPGGTLVFQTPNMLVNVPKEILYTKSLSGWRHYHCSLQTVLSLPRLLRRSGFVPVVIEKHEVCTSYNLSESRKHLGGAGPLLLRCLQAMPLPLYPNFWGHAQKPV